MIIIMMIILIDFLITELLIDTNFMTRLKIMTDKNVVNVHILSLHRFLPCVQEYAR